MSISRRQADAESGRISWPETQLTPGRAARGSARGSTRSVGEAQSHDTESVWNIGEVADYLRLSVHSIYKMTARKAAVRIPHIRIGNKLRFRRADVDRWLTLLTISNMEALAKMRQKGIHATHGHDPQTST